MKKFPVTIIDNFYENPELVRDFALSQEFYPSCGRYPGSRTNVLPELNQELFKTFCEKLFSLFYDLNRTKLSWNVDTSFQKIPSLSKDVNSGFNEGWIHPDDCIFSGVIYLSKENSGTSIFYPKVAGIESTTQNEKYILYSGGQVNEDEYTKAIRENNDNFYESIRINGEFNRLILFEGGLYHGVPSFYNKNEDRLTQVFFVYSVDVENDAGNYPIVRSKVR